MDAPPASTVAAMGAGTSPTCTGSPPSSTTRGKSLVVAAPGAPTPLDPAHGEPTASTVAGMDTGAPPTHSGSPPSSRTCFKAAAVAATAEPPPPAPAPGGPASRTHASVPHRAAVTATSSYGLGPSKVVSKKVKKSKKPQGNFSSKGGICLGMMRYGLVFI